MYLSCVPFGANNKMCKKTVRMRVTKMNIQYCTTHFSIGKWSLFLHSSILSTEIKVNVVYSPVQTYEYNHSSAIQNISSIIHNSFHMVFQQVLQLAAVMFLKKRHDITHIVTPAIFSHSMQNDFFSLSLEQ